MKKLYTLSILFTLTLFLFGIKANAQNIELTLKYNIGSNIYEVYAMPNFTQNNFNWGTSRITVVAPSGTQIGSIYSYNAGTWTNSNSITNNGSNYIVFETNGSLINLIDSYEEILFSFYLVNSCESSMRIFNNGSDPSQINTYDLTNTIYDGNSVNFYSSNYNNYGTICNIIDAVNDPFGPIANNVPHTIDILNNDTLDGAPFNPSVVGLNIYPTAVIPGSSTFDPATGELTIPVGTTPGTYTIPYTICELAMPTNCDTAYVIIVVEDPNNPQTIDAVNDTSILVDPVTGTINVLNVFNNDIINGVVANASNATLTITTPFQNPQSGGILFNANGSIDVLLGTPGGIYTATYVICEVANPINCETANVIINVPSIFNSIISANEDNSSSTPVNALIGATNFINVLTNDTLDGSQALPSNVSLLVLTPATHPNVVLNNFTGNISIAPLTPSGTYTITYMICEIADPSNCCATNVTIVVQNSNLSSDLSIAKTVSNLNPSTGETITFNIVATNNGPDNNSQVFVNSLLPNGYNYISHVTTFGSFLPYTGIWNIGNLNAGESQTLNITAIVNSNGNYSYTSCIQNFLTDLNPNNNCSTSVVNPNYGDHLKLIAFFDANNNGIKDNNEVNFSNGNFTVLNYITNSSYYSYGAIAYVTNSSNTYNLSFQPNNTTIYGCTTTYNNQSIVVGSGETILYFPVTSIPYTEIATYISSNNAPVPGFNYYNTIVLKNNGNQIIPSGTLTFTKDNALTITSISQSGTTSTATGFTYDFTNLLPFETRYIYVLLQVPTIPTVVLGQQVTCSVSVTPSDSTPANNTASVTKTIVGSYDPNDITEIHGEEIIHSTFTSNDYLQYTIRFENTGTANAQKVEVENTLHADLDETTLRMIGSSHSYDLIRVGSDLTWTFNNIQLPPSVPNTTIGHGYIIYEVKPKPGYAVGDIIPNTAEIYFDFNPAIITNTWNTEFVATLSNEIFAFENFTFYPNPTKNNLTITNKTIIDWVQISSVLGQTVFSKNINSLESEIDLSSLSNGIYFVKVKSNNTVKTVKIIKE